MLKVSTKQKYIRIIENILFVCEKALWADEETLLSTLVESQDAIIAVGESLEKEIESSQDIISIMEKLCEFFYQLSQNLDCREVYGKQIQIYLQEIQSKIEALSVCYQIVFFPYKADMWDSLESVWLACKDDPCCDCKVVPIPYYHCNTETDEWEYRYDIEKFPEYVPVVHYDDFDLVEGADAAFIHNPYDDGNFVTNVGKEYFSANLKKYVKNLFYIPYYVTSGFISNDQKDLSAYENVDYIVVQSGVFKEGLKETFYDKKAYVFGSPKLDRVIRLSENKDLVPEKWKSILHGKKSLMLNTSINQFLYDGEAYLKKIKSLFEVVKQRKDVVIIWRPHPLLVSAIETLRPYLLNDFFALKESFIKEEIGIFDETPDIIHTVAIADAYIGETSSSVVNLFEAAGKPLFILNNYIEESCREEELRAFYFCDFQETNGKMYATTTDSGMLFSLERGDWNNIQCEIRVPGPRWMPISSNAMMLENTMYLNPVWSEEVYAYDIEKGIVKQLSKLQESKQLFYRFVTGYKNKVFYFPNSNKQILEYDTVHNVWTSHKAVIQDLQNGITELVLEDVFCNFVENHKVWLTTQYSNRVLCFDMDTAGYKVYELGEPSIRYDAIAVSEGILYLSNSSTGAVEVWDIESMKLRKSYPMPEQYQMFENMQGRSFAHAAMFIVEHYLIAIPNCANLLVRIDLNTDDMSVLAGEFFTDIMEPANNYKPQRHGIFSMVKMLDDETLLLQKRRDASLLELNVLTGVYQIHYPKLAEGELEKLLDGEDGFEKSYTNGEFARRESRYFSVEGFLDDLVHNCLSDAMKRQKEEMQTMAVNLDGTCGEKVHAFMMDVLKNQENN